MTREGQILGGDLNRWSNLALALARRLNSHTVGLSVEVLDQRWFLGPWFPDV